MKQKYSLTVADTEINVITDEPREAIDTIVGVVDRGIREIHLKSKNCSRNEASLLLCLDYCAEKLKLQKKIKMADAEINRLVALNDAATRENAALMREIEALRQNLNMRSVTPPAATRITPSVQLSIAEDLKEEERYVPEKEEQLEIRVEEKAAPLDEILSPSDEVEEAVAEEAEPENDVTAAGIHIVEETRAEEPVRKEPPSKKRVRNMFDLITFDKL